MAEALGPLAQTEMPGFSLMGMLMGGRGYAANWFSQRDKLKMLQAEEERQGAMRQSAAQGILGSPELQQSIANPYDRKAQFGLWGAFQGANVPPEMATLGSNMLQNSVQNIYQREGTTYADQLDRARIKLTADEQLRVDEVKRQRDASFNQKLMQNIFGPDPSTGGQESRIMSDIKRTQAAKLAGLPDPANGYVYTVDPNNPMQLAQRPVPGSKPWTEAAEKIQATENMANDANMLLGHFTGSASLSKGEYQAYRQSLKFAMKKAYETGALDEGTIREFDKTIPEYGTFGLEQGANPLSAKASEQLRVFIYQQQRQAKQISDSAYIPLSDIPSRQREQRTVPEELVEQTQKRLAAPAPGRTGGTRTGAFNPGEDETTIFGPQRATRPGRGAPMR